MSQSIIPESISVLMDGEASELELRRILADENYTEARAVWARYHRVRTVLKKESPTALSVDIATHVKAALEKEPQNTDSSENKASKWYGRDAFRKFAVAASVAAITLTGVKLYNQSEISLDHSVVAESTVQSLPPRAVQSTPRLVPYISPAPAILASYGDDLNQQPERRMIPQTDVKWIRERYPFYLQTHAYTGSDVTNNVSSSGADNLRK